MRKVSIISIFTFLSITIFAQTKTYLAEIEEWHGARIEILKQPNGWLNLEGLFWLKNGVNRFGSASENDLVYNNTSFPKRLGDFKPVSKPFNPYAVLKAISNETLLVALAGLEVANGKTLPQEDKDRLMIAVNRLREAYQICH